MKEPGENQAAAGHSVGPYTVIGPCGRGGFSTVYKATAPGSARPVALKILHAELARDPMMVRRFQREVETVGALRHPHIVEVHGVGETDRGEPYYAMEWLEGPDLERELGRRGSLPVAESEAVVRQLCSALGAAHDRGVVHRDLKASNVVLAPGGAIEPLKLVDFGIAKLLAPERIGAEPITLTSAGTALGTPHYMAPEQIVGATVDARTDLYALGVLFFRMVTGRFPFEGETLPELQDMHLDAPVPRASDFAHVPAHVDEAITRCLQKSPDMRMPSAAALADCLAGAAPMPVSPASRPVAQLSIVVEGMLEEMGADDAFADTVIDSLDEQLVEVRRALVELGLEIPVETGFSIVGVTDLPQDPGRARLQRQAILERALAMQKRAEDAHVRLRFCIDSGTAEGAELHDLPSSGVIASPEALDEMERLFDTMPVRGSRRFIVRNRR